MVLRQFESGDTGVVARPTGRGRFQTRLELRGGSVMADEPEEVGGLGTGPTPYELLSAALAACTVMTLRLYAERKSWPLPRFEVEVAHSLVPGDPPRDRLSRRIAFEGEMEESRRTRLLEIADRCPVHRTLARGFEVVTFADAATEPMPADPPDRHERDMEEACAD
jgi:putative redox protein